MADCATAAAAAASGPLQRAPEQLEVLDVAAQLALQRRLGRRALRARGLGLEIRARPVAQLPEALEAQPAREAHHRGGAHPRPWASDSAVWEALAAGAQVVVLPELITSGYVFSSAEEAGRAAIDPGHELLREWADEARRADAVIVGGFCERGEDGSLYNSAALVDASGLRAVYRKLHLWDGEKLLFAPGSAPPPVLDTPAGRIGVVVCYDLEFPELTRWVALSGAQLLAVPPTGHSSRARPATIVGVDGWVAAERRDAGLLIADVDLEQAPTKRLTEHADAFGDRRPELYASLA